MRCAVCGSPLVRCATCGGNVWVCRNRCDLDEARRDVAQARMKAKGH